MKRYDTFDEQCTRMMCEWNIHVIQNVAPGR